MKPTPYFADRSDNNPAPDFELYAQAGHILCALKATEGVDHVDPKHQQWSMQAHAAKVAVCHYHFCRPSIDTTVDAEAELFTKVLSGTLTQTGLIALDIEVEHPDGIRATNAYANAFSREILRAYRLLPIVYTGLSFLEAHGPDLLLSGQSVWVAAWGPTPVLPSWAKRLWAWQYTNGEIGPYPHAMAGMGVGDGSRLSGPAYRRVKRHRPAKGILLRKRNPNS